MKPGKHQRSKQRGQDLCWKVHNCAKLLLCPHALCMNYVVSFVFCKVLSFKTTTLSQAMISFCFNDPLGE